MIHIQVDLLELVLLGFCFVTAALVLVVRAMAKLRGRKKSGGQ